MAADRSLGYLVTLERVDKPKMESFRLQVLIDGAFDTRVPGEEGAKITAQRRVGTAYEATHVRRVEVTEVREEGAR